MAVLHHYPLSPSSRFIRLQCSEYRFDITLRTQVPWLRDDAFLALNPAGEVPVLEDESLGVVCGARVISEWLEEIVELNKLMPKHAGQRAEVRRLIDWFETKFMLEVSRPLIKERIIKRFVSGQPASSTIMRAALTNAQIHMNYIEWLSAQNPWLAGPDMTLADLVAAAHLSVLDYFGDIDWDRHLETKNWYAKMKSRPSFRELLADQIPGLPAAAHYGNLDF